MSERERMWVYMALAIAVLPASDDLWHRGLLLLISIGWGVAGTFATIRYVKSLLTGNGESDGR